MEADAPFLHALAGGPEGAVSCWTRTADGVRLRVVLWPHAGARGTVLLFSGRTEYAEKYGPAALEFARRGYATATIDWRGQGLSDRLAANPLLGHVRDFADYQHDVAALVHATDRAALPAPRFLLAHSMGGAIGLRALHNGLGVQAAAFSAPMWGIRISPALRPVAQALAWVAPVVGYGEAFAPGTTESPYVLTAPFESNELTHDPARYAAMQAHLRAAPGLGLGGPSLDWLHHALSETRDLRALAPPRIPVVTHLGREESVVSPEAIEALMDRWPGGTLKRIDGARHEIMMERAPIPSRFFDDAAALFAGSATGPGRIA